MKTIKLTEEQISQLKPNKENQEIAEIGFEQACGLLRLTRIRNRDMIESVFPDYKVKSINWEKWTVEVED